MKKLLLLIPVFLFLAASCSTDSDSILEDTANAQTAAKEAALGITPKVTEPCFKEITAHVYNQGTLTNPVISFIADVPSTAPASIGFKVSVELQATDCEDINSGYGAISTYTSSTTFYNILSAPAHIELLPSQTLPCYRWRILLQGFTSTNKLVCASYTQWYDAPML
ncbi:hypothetical protein [Flavobacterium psychrotrophum]|uniref:hypothetical protein n=1 Tax=Flavobacterium psychrotrophum TaxID=2294119 RepID=UPI000E316731|nr:hypothetical protein [Flavobacterium psychrotrophum]